LREELSLLLGAKYNIQLLPEKVLVADWSISTSQTRYQQLIDDPDVDIIISIGVLSSSAVLQQQNYPKPVITVGIVDPLQQQLKLTKQGTSGVHNLSYVLFDRSISNDLNEFHRVFPYKRVAIVASEELFSALHLDGSSKKLSAIQKMVRENGADSVLLPVRDSIKDVLNQIQFVDAVYIGFLGRLEGAVKDDLIQQINTRKLPSFGFSYEDVERGILASAAPVNPMNKLIKRLSLNVEAILSGIDPSELPVHISFEKKLSINVETARKIGFSPKYVVLSEARLVNEFAEAGDPVLTLEQAINTAISANITLKIERDKLSSSKLDVELARTSYFPSLTLNATGTQIDEKRAASSFGQQAETTTSGTLRLEQLLYSEAQSGNIDIQKYLFSATEHGYQQQKLDITLNAAIAYFEILRANTTRVIQKENVSFIRKNLNVAKQREIAGYSGRADVYRWESQLAIATTDALAAENNYKLTKIKLNQLLDRSLDQEFKTDDVSIKEGVYANYLSGINRDYIDSPASLKKFTNFLIIEAVDNSPEILKINATIDAQKRRLTSARKKRYLPSVSLIAEAQRIFSRDGEGANVPGVTAEDDSWTANMNLSWPIYSGGATGVEGQQAGAEIIQLKDQRILLHQNLKLNVRAALLDVVTKAVNFKSSQRSAEFGNKTLVIVQDEYSKGKASFVELADAKNTASSTEQRAVNSIYEYFTAVLKLERAVGKFTIFSDENERAAYNKRLDEHFHTVQQTDTSLGVN
jgi:outer membrane protein TolC/ABC-type uncharacterized transport system substrate-binding protein